MAVSLRLSDELKERLARLAESQDVSPHSLMIAAIEEKIEALEAQHALEELASRRLRRMKRTGMGIPADEVFVYLEKRAGDPRAKRPKARKIP